MDFFLLNKEQYQFERLSHEVEEFEEIVGFFKSVVTSLNENLYWLEQNGRIVSLVSCPKNIDEKVHTLFFERDFSTILTSATITGTSKGTIEDRYSYIRKNIGFPSDSSGFLSDPKQSPFPYNEHAMIYYCSDLPHPTLKREEFLLKGTERLVELLNISKGKSLVLFTVKIDLEYVFDKLNKMNLTFNVLVQDDGSSQAKILKEFKDDINSVLLATGSYWEGINVEGESLSNLVVFRLPFPVPDPIIDYKCSISKDPMMDVRVPEMIIKLKQGVGRLIRSKTDKGIVCILDPRIGDDNNSPYKEIVWEALPMKRKTNSLDEIRKFYNTTVASNE